MHLNYNAAFLTTPTLQTSLLCHCMKLGFLVINLYLTPCHSFVPAFAKEAYDCRGKVKEGDRNLHLQKRQNCSCLSFLSFHRERIIRVTY